MDKEIEKTRGREKEDRMEIGPDGNIP